MKEPLVVAVQAKSVVKYLLLITVLLLFMNIGVIARYKLISTSDNFFSVMFNFDLENNVPSYFSTYLLLTSSLILALITILKKKQNNPFAFHWAGLAIVFLGLSLDESLALHNRVEKLLGPLEHIIASSPLLSFSWVIPGILFVGIFVFIYLQFLLSLSKKTRMRFCAAGAVYVLGAIGFEMIGSYFFIPNTFNWDNLAYMTVMTIEETLEMLGAIMFIGALLDYVQVYISEYEGSIE